MGFVGSSIAFALMHNLIKQLLECAEKVRRTPETDS